MTTALTIGFIILYILGGILARLLAALYKEDTGNLVSVKSNLLLAVFWPLFALYVSPIVFKGNIK